MTTAIAPPPPKAPAAPQSRTSSRSGFSDFGAQLDRRVERSARKDAPAPAEAPQKKPDAAKPDDPREQPVDTDTDRTPDATARADKPQKPRKPESDPTDERVSEDIGPEVPGAAEKPSAPTPGLKLPGLQDAEPDADDPALEAGDAPAGSVEAKPTASGVSGGVMPLTPPTSTPIDLTTDAASPDPAPQGRGAMTGVTAKGQGPAPEGTAEATGTTPAGESRGTAKAKTPELPAPVQPGGEGKAEAAVPVTPAGKVDFLSTLHSLTQTAAPTEGPRPAHTSDLAPTTPASAPSYAPEARFAEANTANIVQGVRQQLLPNGGTMTLRLDPPEVGALQVSVMMKDGLASVSFLTDNPEAARMMTNTLTQLRDALSTSGLTVDRLTVSQAPRSEGSSQSNTNSQQQQGQGDPRGQGFGFHDDARRDQQRRDLMERMWRKVTGDDINLVA